MTTEAVTDDSSLRKRLPGPSYHIIFEPFKLSSKNAVQLSEEAPCRGKPRLHDNPGTRWYLH